MESINTFYELKNDAKSRYYAVFLKFIENEKGLFFNDFSKIVGEYYFDLKNKYKSVLKEIEQIKFEFLNSIKYKSCYDSFVISKQENDKFNGEDIEAKNKFNESLNNLTTLNTTLNNKLKSRREQIESIKTSLTSIFKRDGEKLLSLKKRCYDEIAKELSSVLKEYNSELKELCETFAEKYEYGYPFDVNSFELNSIIDEVDSMLYFELENHSSINAENNNVEIVYVDENGLKS